MARVPVYHPKVQVVLRKTIARSRLVDGVPVSERFAGSSGRVIDLAPWLGEAGSVRVSKSTREAAGGFSLTLSDRIVSEQLDSMYGLFEPMDMVEIRMSHEPHLYAGQSLPIVMRGFISEVRRAESVGSDGKPRRQVVISGQDYGKIWQIIQIYYLPGRDPVGATLLRYFRLFAQYGGFSQNTMPAAQLLDETIRVVVNPYITSMTAAGDRELLQFDPAAAQVENGTIAPWGLGSWNGGTVRALLEHFLDVGPWNELFTEDREDGVHVVYRANPFYSAAGDLINTGASAPDEHVVDGADVMSLTVSRSDANLANLYWVDSPRSMLNNQGTLKLDAARSAPEGTFDTFAYQNSALNLYGLRRMEHATQQGHPDLQYNGNGLPETKLKPWWSKMGDWMFGRRQSLIAQNKDNILFENGTARIRGREDIKAGSYVVIRRGSFEARYYVPRVEHDFMPFGGFFTTLTLERGDGFIRRAQRGAGKDSPYYAELTR